MRMTLESLLLPNDKRSSEFMIPRAWYKHIYANMQQVLFRSVAKIGWIPSFVFWVECIVPFCVFLCIAMSIVLVYTPPPPEQGE